MPDTDPGASVATQWITEWTKRVSRISCPDDLRPFHQWLWQSWTQDGVRVAAEINGTLGLGGSDEIKSDIPNTFAGDLSRAQILLVNINPGWDRERNQKEEEVVRKSEQAAWDFSRELFTRYRADVGPMYWWNRCIGVALRIRDEYTPKMTAQQKREWANRNLASFELFPLHSSRSGFLGKIAPGASPLQTGISAGMRATLEAALRMRVRLTLVLSSGGAKFVGDIAQVQCWTPVPGLPDGLPNGSAAYRMAQSTLIAIPKPLVSRNSALPSNAVAAAIRQVCSIAV